MPRFKPGRWAASPAQVDAEWLWAWRRLEAAWILNEGSGPPVNLVHPNQVGTLVNNPQWVAGPHGPALRFQNASAQRVNTNSAQRINFASQTFTSAFTVRLIFTAPADLESNFGLFASATDSAGGGWQFAMSTGLTDFNIRAAHRRDSQNQQTNLIAPVVAGRVYDAVYTFTSTGPTSRLYTDGVQRAINTTTLAPDAQPSGRVVSIGGWEGTTFYANDLIHGVWVWSRELSATEVLRLYMDPYGAFRPAVATLEEEAAAETVDVDAILPILTADVAIEESGFSFPPNITAVAQSDSSILVDWDAESGADAYAVERDGIRVAFPVTATQFLDTGLDPATEYDYRVRSARRV